MSESTLQSNEMPLSEGGNNALSGQDTVSDSVALALSTALQKIETYVPTQWVDNTEPDIDAAHLNHAEQAIMRVTNLMNGAVDVINSLSTQVDELNGKMESGFIKRGSLSDSSINDENFFKILDIGMYQVVGVNKPYFPISYGTIINLMGTDNYGAMLVFEYTGDLYARTYSIVNGTWYTGWKKIQVSDL